MADTHSRITLELRAGASPAALLDFECVEVEVLRGPDAGARRRSADAVLTIGASRENNLVLTDPAASRRHARLRRLDEGLELEDLGSTNGTFLEGQRVETTRLAEEQEFTIGACVLRARVLREQRREPVSPHPRLGALVGGSQAMRDLYAMLRAVAPTGVTVLITGETGVGKELVARELHRLSGRSGPLSTFDAAGADPGQVASALFGHRKGAFTGAAEAREGAARRAHRGTLFMDEIGELPLDLQPRLLRLLERREVTPMGADRPMALDLRVVAATHRDLRGWVEAGRFRADLFHRLAVVEVQVPPLRDRLEDLPALVAEISAAAGPPLDITDEAWAALRAYPWPGNVRELRNCLERARALAGGGPVSPRQLGLPGVPGASPSPTGPAPLPGGSDVAPSPPAAPPTAPATPPSAPAPAPGTPLEDIERQTILAALARNDGHRVRTAEQLGISLNTLKRRLRKYRAEGTWEG